MKVTTIFYAFKRIKQLGLRGVLAAMRRRLRSRVWRGWWRLLSSSALSLPMSVVFLRVVPGLIRHPVVIWKNLVWIPARRPGRRTSEKVHRNFQHSLPILSILNSPTFQSLLPASYKNKALLTAKADAAAAHVFDLLGSGPVQLTAVIDWHHDFKKDCLRPPFNTVDASFSYAAYAKTFHLDIPVPQRGNDVAVYHEDIKVLWDLGRMHHLSTLGMAYGATRDERYVQAFVGDVASFQDQVKFARGPHWKCPMDVAIRAINLIWAEHFFRGRSRLKGRDDKESAAESKKKQCADSDFWQRYDRMLHDHLVYLEWNFEESDKPNNHLLADYVGYLYLGAFFREQPGGEKKLNQAIALVRAEFARQILFDGTAYEGSTAYHRLDCELLLHATSLMRVLGRPDEMLEALLDKMLAFLAAVTDQGGNLATVGDDDSGTVVFGVGDVRMDPGSKPGMSGCIFPHFGLGVLRTDRFHLTLRAPVMQPHQPSGHFHHDALSMTLSIDGQPLFVDPGSFVYTANAWWRNQFKRAASHSTFFMPRAVEENGGDLFQTRWQYVGGEIAATAGGLVATAVMPDGVVLTREVVLDNEVSPWILKRVQDDTMSIDVHGRHPELVSGSMYKTSFVIRDCATQPSACTWCFILHPSIRCEQVEDGIDFFVGARRIATLQSTLNFVIKKDAGFAAGYGQFERTTALEAAGISQSTAQEMQIIHYPVQSVG